MKQDEKSGKNYYLDYRDFCGDLDSTEKKIRDKLSVFKIKIKNGSPTIDLQKEIKESLEHYKEIHDNLKEAYSNRKAPAGFPLKELDKRQKQIQTFGFTYDALLKEYNANENENYRFKGEIDEDYTKKEEFRNMGRDELLRLEKKKLEDQDKQIDEITVEVKKDTQLAKYTKHTLENQNKKLEQINEDMDRTDEKMKTLTNRFKNYASNLSWCKIIFIMIIELVIALLAYIFLFNK